MSTRLYQTWVEGAREFALEKVNKTHDKEAPRFNAKRSEIDFQPGDLVLEWSPATKPGLVSKLCRKWRGPLVVLAELIPGVTYKVEPVGKKRKPYVVHVERLKHYTERLDEDCPDEFEHTSGSTSCDDEAENLDKIVPDYLHDGSPLDQASPNVPPPLGVLVEQLPRQRPRRNPAPISRLINSMASYS